MKNILVFSAGERGRDLVNQYIEFGGKSRIAAIVDNCPMMECYRGIEVVLPERIGQFEFDEIWVCTIYYPQIRKQLIEEFGISSTKIIYVDPVMPLIDERIRNRYEKLLKRGVRSDNGELIEVLEYIADKPARMYCYPFYDEYIHKDAPVFYDEDKRLFYVMHSSKKMYFSRKFDTEQKARCYYNAIAMEQDERSPHCYWNDEGVRKSINGVVVDVGAAEGIFALDAIDSAEHIYMFEVEEDWIEALQCTFEPYVDKVTIIRKFVSDYDDEEHCRLDTVFKNCKMNCIKMDIEGVEMQALKGAENILKEQEPVLAVCVYHHQDDNQIISEWLQKQGFSVSNSKGYVLCQGEWELDKDEADFRRALIFGKKEQEHA